MNPEQQAKLLKQVEHFRRVLFIIGTGQVKDREMFALEAFDDPEDALAKFFGEKA